MVLIGVSLLSGLELLLVYRIVVVGVRTSKSSLIFIGSRFSSAVTSSCFCVDARVSTRSHLIPTGCHLDFPAPKLHDSYVPIIWDSSRKPQSTWGVGMGVVIKLAVLHKISNQHIHC